MRWTEVTRSRFPRVQARVPWHALAVFVVIAAAIVIVMTFEGETCGGKPFTEFLRSAVEFFAFGVVVGPSHLPILTRSTSLTHPGAATMVTAHPFGASPDPDRIRSRLQ